MIDICKYFCDRYYNIVTIGLDKDTDCVSVVPLTFSHLVPYNQWERKKVSSDDIIRSYIIDKTNQDQYWYDDPVVKRTKCLALCLATPIVHTIGMLLILVNKISKIVTLAHFWYPRKMQCTFNVQISEFGKDLLKIALLPIILVGLELSVIYGLILPYDGAKLYASFERAAYGEFLLAPCFQPAPIEHLFGGNPGEENQW